MLYEVITLSEIIELSLHSHILKSVVSNQELTLEIKPDSLINVMRVLIEDANCQFRITSYNVCYTKLLRIQQAFL